MTREEAKELLPIIKAFAEGKTIECKNLFGSWTEAKCPSWSNNFEYRIKPEPKYRPFENQEECWNEMLKHQPLGWVRYDDSITAVQNIAPEGITVNDGIKTSSFYFEECLMNMKFADDTPFGVEDK